MAIDADVELGGVDQLLNHQMCRKVMEISDQAPEVVITTPLMKGTDGTGTKMSKSKGNYVGLTASPDDVYGRIMSIPDHLTEPYLQLLTEWTDAEIPAVTERREVGNRAPDGGQAHPRRRGGGRSPRTGRRPQQPARSSLREPPSAPSGVPRACP
ncbi:hypothetical protein [Streptomyces sp. TRM68367]|uniref:hypothetical protein n=1 Tax=Streptomyces sp. TRM68367 TaxID=2758415 RepID=UPI00293519C6|nr:hypothetical protein [Streptomyces sp. TRM68367]